MSETIIRDGGPPYTITSLLQLEIDALAAGISGFNAKTLGTLIAGNVLSNATGDASHLIAVSVCSAAENPIGLSLGPVVADEIGRVITSGPLTLTTAEWDAVKTGGVAGGLVPGAMYYLSGTTGKITATVPAGGPSTVSVAVGFALSATMLFVRILPVLVVNS